MASAQANDLTAHREKRIHRRRVFAPAMRAHGCAGRDRDSGDDIRLARTGGTCVVAHCREKAIGLRPAPARCQRSPVRAVKARGIAERFSACPRVAQRDPRPGPGLQGDPQRRGIMDVD